MKKIVTVLGARPQFIKASVVSHAIRQADGIVEILVHTGQHFDANMSSVFFDELQMAKPEHFLDVHGGSHGAMTGRMLAGVEKILLSEKPDAVLVFGDTNSTLAGALAAVKLHIPVAHVESGLRSFNMKMPEEVNRILTDRISRWLFTPTDIAAKNLLAEGIHAQHIYPVGDVMYDVALHYGARVQADSGLMRKLGLVPKNYILATVHRAENTDDPVRMTAIVDGLLRATAVHPVVWPLHPRTRNTLQAMGIFDRIQRHMHILDPVGYLDMIQLEKFAALIATDSGGVQKEAFFFRTPCVTLRDETEWIELIESGWNRLAAPNSAETIYSAIASSVNAIGAEISPYGQGDAARQIVSTLLQVAS